MTKRLKRAKKQTKKKWKKILKYAKKGNIEVCEDLAEYEDECGFCTEYHNENLNASCTGCPMIVKGLRCDNWPSWVYAFDMGTKKPWIKLAKLVLKRSKNAKEK